MYKDLINESKKDLNKLKHFFSENNEDCSLNILISYIERLNVELDDIFDNYTSYLEHEIKAYLNQLALNISLLSLIDINDKTLVANIGEQL